MIDDFKRSFNSLDKTLVYVQKSLRGSRAIFDKGGHVTSVYCDQAFRLIHDNRRDIEETPLCLDSTVKPECRLRDSAPLMSKEKCSKLRKLASLTGKRYDKTTNQKAGSLYKNLPEIAVRVFIRDVLSNDPQLGLSKNDFKTYGDIIQLIKGCSATACVRISKSSISQLKNKSSVNRTVPRNESSEVFVKYVKNIYPAFKDSEFFK